jgi:ribose-phosphate pyrophosphokinase
MIKFNGTIIEQGNFPDGSLHLKLTDEQVESPFDNAYIIIEWFYENDSELFTLMCLRKHFAAFPAVLIMPYCPHARMDRVKNVKDVFTLKYFAEVINSLDFKVVYCDDIHSNVGAALIDNYVPLDPEHCSALDAIAEIEEENNTELVACYPDEGAMKRYSEDIDMPYAFGIKKRDWKTGKILGLDLMNKEIVEGKDVIIIDDICSRGGTFYYTAKALKDAGAKDIYLFVTHCEKTVLDGDLIKSGLIKKLYTTDSILPVEYRELPFFQVVE